MMKRLIAIAAVASMLGGCTLIDEFRNENPYDNPFYAKYMDPNVAADARALELIETLRTDRRNAVAHNELGQLLAAKGFPKDAEREFEAAINADGDFYPAWYNLALLRAARGDVGGARVAFRQTLRHKPGHPAALFQMGLMEEQRGNRDAATDYYAKSILINRSMLDVKVNPRIVDSKLIHLALLKAYPKQHNRNAIVFQGAPAGYAYNPPAPQSPSPEAKAGEIVPPAPPVTDPSQQAPPPPPPPNQ